MNRWIVGLGLLAVLALIGLSGRALALEPTVGLFSANSVRSQAGGTVLDPGWGIEGIVRFTKVLAGGLSLQHYRLNNTTGNWVLFSLVVDCHFTDPESRFDPFLGIGLGDSVFQARQGIGVTGRAGMNYWLLDKMAFTVSTNFIRTIGLDITDPRHPNFSAGSLNGGIRFRF